MIFHSLGRFLSCLDRFRHDWKGLDMIRKLILTCLSNLSFLPGGFAPRTPQKNLRYFFFIFQKMGFRVIGMVMFHNLRKRMVP